MTPEREQRLLAILRRRQPDLTLITDKVHKPRNIAALVRNCDAVGIPRMHVVKPDHEYRRYRGTSRGSDRWVDSVLHESLDDAIGALDTPCFLAAKAYAIRKTKAPPNPSHNHSAFLVTGAPSTVSPAMATARTLLFFSKVRSPRRIGFLPYMHSSSASPVSSGSHGRSLTF